MRCPRASRGGDVYCHRVSGGGAADAVGDAGPALGVRPGVMRRIGRPVVGDRRDPRPRDRSDAHDRRGEVGRMAVAHRGMTGQRPGRGACARARRARRAARARGCQGLAGGRVHIQDFAVSLSDQDGMEVGIENRPVGIFAWIGERSVWCVSHEVKPANYPASWFIITAL